MELKIKKKYTNRTYKKAERIYRTGDTNFEKNLHSSPKGLKRKRS